MFTALASTLGDNMAFGGKVTLIGVLVVFLLLGLIVLILMFSDFINKKLANAPKRERKSKKDKTDSTEVSVVTVSEDVAHDDATVAAVIGAITAILTSETAEADSDARFVVRKIKKLNFKR